MPVRALVVGSFVMDLSFQVPKRPSPGEVVVATSFGRFRGGKGYNQAVALARLGADVSMIGAVGEDDFGAEFIQALDREGIDRSGVHVLPDVSTSVAAPMVTPDGDVAFVHAPGANHHVPVPEPDEVPPCDLLFVQGEVNADATLAVARIVERRGARVFLNAGPVSGVPQELLALSDILCVNEVEARELAGDAVEDDVNPLDLARRLAVDGRTVVVTLGARGAAYVTSDASGHVPGFRVDAVDATGAGDSFCAALGWALGEGRDVADAVRFACAAGAHAATVRGAEPGLPTLQQVERLLRRHSDGRAP